MTVADVSAAELIGRRARYDSLTPWLSTQWGLLKRCICLCGGSGAGAY